MLYFELMVTLRLCFYALVSAVILCLNRLLRVVI